MLGGLGFAWATVDDLKCNFRRAPGARKDKF
jgi:hypothetical protein